MRRDTRMIGKSDFRAAYRSALPIGRVTYGGRLEVLKGQEYMDLKKIAYEALKEAGLIFQEDDLEPVMDYGTREGALLGWEHRCRRMPKSKIRKLKFPVVSVSPAPFNNVADALNWGREHIVGVIDPRDSGGKGVVTVSMSSLREMLNQRQRSKSASNEVHYAALQKIPEIIREGIIVESHPDFLKGADGKRSKEVGVNYDVAINVAYSALKFKENSYRVKTTYKKYKLPDARKAYAYEVSEIEVLPGTLGGRANPTTNPSGETSICADILLKGAVDVKGVPLLN